MKHVSKLKRWTVLWKTCHVFNMNCKFGERLNMHAHLQYAICRLSVWCFEVLSIFCMIINTMEIGIDAQGSRQKLNQLQTGNARLRDIQLTQKDSPDYALLFMTTLIAYLLFLLVNISSIFDKCSMLLQMIWPWNHTFHTKVHPKVSVCVPKTNVHKVI